MSSQIKVRLLFFILHVFLFPSNRIPQCALIDRLDEFRLLIARRLVTAYRMKDEHTPLLRQIRAGGGDKSLLFSVFALSLSRISI